MRKSIFKCSALILFSLVITIAYTSAWFSGQAVSSKNVMKSGTLILNAPGQVIGESEFKNIFPGWQDSKTVTIENKGTIPMRCKMSIISDEDSLLFNGEYGIHTAINNIEDNRYKGKPVKLGDVNDAYIGTIEPGNSKNIQLDFSFPEYADSSYSGLSSNFKFCFDAVQKNMPLIFDANQEKFIQAAIDTAKNTTENDGDIVSIGNGNYDAELNISKSITLKGDEEGSIVHCSDKSQKNTINISSSGGYVNFDGIEFDDGTNIVINVNSFIHDLNFSNCKFNSKGICVFISGSVNTIKLDNCSFSDYKYVFSFPSNSNSVIVRNLYIVNDYSFQGPGKINSNVNSIGNIYLNGNRITPSELQMLQNKK